MRAARQKCNLGDLALDPCSYAAGHHEPFREAPARVLLHSPDVSGLLPVQDGEASGHARIQVARSAGIGGKVHRCRSSNLVCY